MLKIGDVVRLNSGGPLMTVAFIAHNNIVRAVWFIDGKTEVGDFPQEVLTKED